MKKQSNNKLKCRITGIERISNRKYLAAKAEKNNITVEEFKAFYVCKSALTAMKESIDDHGLVVVAKSTGRPEEDIKKMVGYNGRGLRKSTKKARELKKDEVAISTEDASVALELAQAEIERTKEKLVEKNQITQRDRRNARRRELYAEKKRQEAKSSVAV